MSFKLRKTSTLPSGLVRQRTEAEKEEERGQGQDRGHRGPGTLLSAIMRFHKIDIIRAVRKSQFRKCLGFCTVDLWSPLAYESAEQKP